MRQIERYEVWIASGSPDTYKLSEWTLVDSYSEYDAAKKELEEQRNYDFGCGARNWSYMIVKRISPEVVFLDDADYRENEND